MSNVSRNRPLFRPESMGSRQSDIFGTTLKAPSNTLRLFVIATFIAVVAFVIAISFIPYTKKEGAEGVVIARSGESNVRSPATGVVEEVFVEEGQYVSAGQPIAAIYTDVMIDKALFLSEAVGESVRQQKSSIERRVEALGAVSGLRRQATERKLVQAAARLTHLAEERRLLEERLELEREEVEIFMSDPMTSSALDRTRAKSRLVDSRLQLANLTRDIQDERARQEDLTNELSVHQHEVQEQIALLDLERAAIQERLLRNQSEGRFMLRSPIDGQVSLLSVSRGDAVDPGQQVASVLGEDADLEIMIELPERALAHVRPGQEVTLRFHAFPYRQFGLRKGAVRYISSTAGTGRTRTGGAMYAARITPIRTSPDDATERLLPGMTVSANVMVDRRTIAEWFLDPIVEAMAVTLE